MVHMGQRPGPDSASAARRVACAAFLAAGAVLLAVASVACGSSVAPSAHVGPSSTAVGGDTIPPPSVATGPASSSTSPDITGPASPSPSPAMPAPIVSSISPTAGGESGGDSVIVTGKGFTDAKEVRFGNASASKVTVNSDTEIIAISPPGTGTVDVTVVTPVGVSPTGSADQFTYVAS